MIKSRVHLQHLIRAAEQIAEDGLDIANDLDETMDKAERDTFGITCSRCITDFKSSRRVVSNVMQEPVRLCASNNRVTGIRTGCTDPDRMISDFQCGDLITLAARPAVGRTALALNPALNVSLYNSRTIAIFSPEMPAEALIRHILSAKSAVGSNKLRSDAALDDELDKLNEVVNKLMTSKLFVDDSSNIKVSEVLSRCRKLRSEYGLDLVVIDYLQLISGSGKSGDNHQQEMSEISRSLKGLAREMEYSAIAPSQLLRSVETHPDKRPMLSDLRESGVIEQDADTVMFLYHDTYYAKDDEVEQNNPIDQTDLDITEHRSGATGKVELAFQKSISTFFNIAHDGFP